jgi:hypothetical protein
MNDRFEEEAAVATDAYIDWLLDARRPGPHAVEITGGPNEATRRTIALLHGRLPRFHPSFTFEEQLAARLRAAAEPNFGAEGARILRFTIDPPAASAVAARRVDPRVLIGVGGAALASGVSMAAVYAWRHASRRPRRHTEVPA